MAASIGITRRPPTYDPENSDVPKPQDPVTDNSTVQTPLEQLASIDLVKTGKVGGRGLAGDIVTYSFVLKPDH